MKIFKSLVISTLLFSSFPTKQEEEILIKFTEKRSSETFQWKLLLIKIIEFLGGNFLMNETVE